MDFPDFLFDLVSGYVYLPIICQLMLQGNDKFYDMLFLMVEFQTSWDFRPEFTHFYEFCELIFALI